MLLNDFPLVEVSSYFIQHNNRLKAKLNRQCEMEYCERHAMAHKCIPLFRCTYFLLAVFLFSKPVNAECMNAERALSLTKEELFHAVPCDIVVEAYIRGLGIKSGKYKSFDGRVLSEFPYYLPVRRFLGRKLRGSSPNFEEEFGFLLAALSHLTDSQSERESLYRVFILSEYWSKNSSQNHDSIFWISKALQENVQKTSFENMRHIQCFIQHDMPVVEVSTVVASLSYTNCTEGN